MSFMDVIPLLLATTLSAGWWFVRRASKKLRFFGIISSWMILYALPWFAGDSIVCRSVTTLTCCALFAPKLLDAAMSPETWNGFSFGDWLRYILNPFILCFRRHLSDRPRTMGHYGALFVRGILQVLIGSVLLFWSFHVNWTDSSFWLEHITKLVGAYLAIFDGGFVLVNGVLGIWGGTYMDFSRHPVLATTPADFWRRYNRDAGRFFYEDVYSPLGRLPRPARIGLVFLLNGLLHEYLVLVMARQIVGVIFAFFLLQAVAVLLTWRLRPSGRMALTGVILTAAFNVTSTVLIFTSIFAWYAQR